MSGFSIDFFPSKLGGGIPGGQPKGGLLGGGGGSSGGSGMQGGGPRGIDRTVLRQAFGLVTIKKVFKALRNFKLYRAKHGFMDCIKCNTVVTL